MRRPSTDGRENSRVNLQLFASLIPWLRHDGGAPSFWGDYFDVFPYAMKRTRGNFTASPRSLSERINVGPYDSALPRTFNAEAGSTQVEYLPSCVPDSRFSVVCRAERTSSRRRGHRSSSATPGAGGERRPFTGLLFQPESPEYFGHQGLFRHVMSLQI